MNQALRALANERRFQILEWLKDPAAHFPPQTDGDLVEDGVCGVLIAEKLGVTQPTASEHLKILSQAGLVRSKRIKQWIFYRRDEARIDGFKQAMLNAKSIGFVDQTPTAAALKAIFAKLGIADEIKSKLKPLTIQAAVAVTNGDVEIAMTQISEILPYPGVELAGPLPPDIQTYTTFSAGISAAAKNAEAAAALIKFLTSPDAKAMIKAKGMEPG